MGAEELSPAVQAGRQAPLGAAGLAAFRVAAARLAGVLQFPSEEPVRGQRRGEHGEVRLAVRLHRPALADELAPLVVRLVAPALGHRAHVGAEPAAVQAGGVGAGGRGRVIRREGAHGGQKLAALRLRAGGPLAGKPGQGRLRGSAKQSARVGARLFEVGGLGGPGRAGALSQRWEATARRRGLPGFRTVRRGGLLRLGAVLSGRGLVFFCGTGVLLSIVFFGNGDPLFSAQRLTLFFGFFFNVIVTVFCVFFLKKYIVQFVFGAAGLCLFFWLFPLATGGCKDGGHKQFPAILIFSRSPRTLREIRETRL